MNNSTVSNLQLAPPTVLTAQEAVARLVALEAENARLQAGIADLRLVHHPWCGMGYGMATATYERDPACDCGADAQNARLATLLTGTP